MTAEQFISDIAALAPSSTELKSIGLSDNGIKFFQARYIALAKGNSQYKVGDQILQLISDYDCSTLTIGMIEFYNKPVYETLNILFGDFDTDLLAITTDGSIVLLDGDNHDYIMCKCAVNGGHFLEAIVVAAGFLSQCPFNEDLRENQTVIFNISEECAERAGGQEFIDFYLMLLGYDPPRPESER